ncbi:MAG: hypothetical protein M1818_004814 [Claussenomyces sp. TS43310]|nr:MAG: hypothetical protein M1818_004814 [Claussenomyces sp. TS43310]
MNKGGELDSSTFPSSESPSRGVAQLQQSHLGVLGDAEADKAAKEAARQPTDAQDIFTLVSAINPGIQANARPAWSRDWCNGSTGGTTPTLDGKVLAKHGGLPKPSSAILTSPRIGRKGSAQ